ncbi:hypothetical protein EV182_005858 [Spiromyces aspiralis]|uniref:Uncharacterized protein n=1 Tax=Spiromyces aspiralis TaxID=68401 RepID=A0ACC1HR46_9FUNG|nr:hypothetical protein EV182_005858 [Spiromyces aspiralis]
MHLHTPSPARAGDEDEDHLAPHFADALNTASSVANSASRLNRLSGITLNNDIPTSPSSSYPELHHHSSLVFGPYASNPSSGTTPAAISSPLLYDDSFEASVPSALNSKPGKFRSKLKRIIELFRPAPMTQDQLETMLRI